MSPSKLVKKQTIKNQAPEKDLGEMRQKAVQNNSYQARTSSNDPKDLIKELVSPPTISNVVSVNQSVPSQSLLLKNKSNYVELENEDESHEPEYEYNDIVNSYLVFNQQPSEDMQQPQQSPLDSHNLSMMEKQSTPHAIKNVQVENRLPKNKFMPFVPLKGDQKTMP